MDYKKMGILQLIDSLEAGGAERMAVNYANALVNHVSFSGLVVTRKEGPLRNQVDEKVSYLFLNKERTLDFKAILRLRKYVLQNKVSVVHTHSTSFFLAFLLKLTLPSLQLIWHDHYGNSEFLSKRPIHALRIIIPFFSGVIAVNQNLKRWTEEKLSFKKVIYLPNFPSEEKGVDEQTILKGIAGKRIVSSANLRVQKDHFLLLEVARKLKVSHPDWTFHLIGKDFKDEYSQQIKDLIVTFNLEKNVFLYGTKSDVKNILEEATIAILTSQSEGLPVALLEYGWYKKPVVVTAVGEISALIQNGKNGFIVAARESELFYDALVALIESKTLQMNFGNAFYKTIVENYSEEIVIKKYLNWLLNNCK
ncbi:glycosyltransferase family 4 protein [Flavobacterium sp. XS2P39]|uniref:glycosyltransferase family 4 protein n=1 Tax=Flavobacterium sp. XS2P39 TaxID=3401725 RepID=UPI003AAF47B5